MEFAPTVAPLYGQCSRRQESLDGKSDFAEMGGNRMMYHYIIIG